MRIVPLLDGLEYNDRRPHAMPLAAGSTSRAVCFTLRAGQSLRAHDALGSHVYLFVLEGDGVFGTGADGVRRVSASALVVIEPGEAYSVRALSDLVFVAVRDGAPASAAAPPDHELAGTHR